MAVDLLAYDVSDLSLGKPPLRSLSAAATIAAALAALKSSDETVLSVWSCDHSSQKNPDCVCVCVGKVCMVDIVCYLCREENLASPSSALKSPVSVLLPEVKGLVRHVEPSLSLLEAIDLTLQGAQNLVVPIKSNLSKRKHLQKASTAATICPTNHNGQEFCWLAQEDIIKFLLSSISLFSPVPSQPIETLGVISHEILTVEYHRPASSAVRSISLSLMDQTSVAVVDNDGTLIGEISPHTLSCCDESVGPAILTLSAGDLMAYIDCGGPPDEIVRVVESRLKERNLQGVLEDFMINFPGVADTGSSSSSDEELAGSARRLRRRYSSGHLSRMVRTAEAIVCYRRSSLVAVMIQAIAHNVNYVWVIEDDYSLVGIVTFANMLRVFRGRLL